MKISIVLTIALSVLMVGCGGSGGKSSKSSSSSVSSISSTPSSVVASSSEQASSVAATVLRGVFLDAAVSNIGYRTATQQGFTNTNGEFTYQAGELITFFIGSMELPGVVAKDILTPLDIASTDSLADNQLINILRLLQSLDADGNPGNGIEITAAAIAAGVALDFTVAPEVFAQMPAVLALLQAAEKQLISTEQAITHFQTTLELINGPSSSSSSSTNDSSSSASSDDVIVIPGSSASSVDASTSSSATTSSSSSTSSDDVIPGSSSSSSDSGTSSSVDTSSSTSSTSSSDDGVIIGSSSSASSEAPVNTNVQWNLYNALYHPAIADSVTLSDGSTTAFNLGTTGDYFNAVNGSVILDTSAAGTLTSGASITNVVNANGVYPKYFTLIAGVTGNSDNLRVLELEIAMADEGKTGSRLKTILRNDGSNKGVQLESANNGSSVNSYGVTDMDKFAIYQIAITLTSSTKGSVQVYRNGVAMPNLSLTDVTMRATAADAGENFLRFGEVSGSAAYKSSVDWLVWTNEAALTPAQAAESLPVDADLGCVYGYGEANDTTTCFNPPASGSSSSSLSSDGSSNSSFPAADIRPAKMEGFAAHAGVTGGAGGPVITVSTGTELNAALCGIRNGNRTAPVIIMVNGTINHGNTTAQGCDTQKDVIEIKNTSNISIIGVGTNALFDEIGIHVRDASNIILQNLHIRNVKKSGTPTSNGGDAIGLETRVDRVWIDHNWLEASGGEKAGYDSLLDMKAGVTNVTVSYNLFNDSSRAGLIGSSDSDNKNTNITFHHNWYKNIEQRTPLIRHALVHVYNNYWSNPTQNYMFHGINSRMNAKALVESNYFHNTNNPLIASDDSKEPGCWQTNNDNIVTPSIYYSRTVGNGALVVPAVVDGQLQSTCAVTVPYTVTMDAASDVPSIVMSNAGVGKIGNAGTSSASSVSSSAGSDGTSSESSSSTSSSVPAATTSFPIVENFNVDRATLFSAAYQAISTDASAARYFITGGGSGITVTNNELGISAARFTIGHRPPRTATTATDTNANGDFDLSRPYRISFNVVATSGTGKLQVYIDNSTTSVANSLHGASSRVFDAAVSSLVAGQLIEITPIIGTATSFIAFRTESSTSVTIDNLKIEYLDEGSTGSSASSEAESSASSAASSSWSVASSEPEASSSSSMASSEPVASSSSVASSEPEASSSSSVASSEQEASSSSSMASSEPVVSSSSVASSEPEVSSSSSSSSSTAAIVNTALPLTEDFNNVVDAPGFFSTAYKALASSEISFYRNLSGTPGFVNSEMIFGNARFTLGNTTPAVSTKAEDTATTGELDLSQPYRISFCVKATQGAGNFQVYVDNNTTGQGNSIHGNASRIYSGAASALILGQRVVINSSVGSETSFIGLRAESSAQVTIDDLWIGYQSDLSTEPAANTCVAPTPVAPAAPQVTADDAQLSVSWSAVNGATSYEVVYNTVDSVDGATAFENNPVTGTSAVITGLTNDTTYFVFVRAINASGESEYSIGASGKPEVASEEPSFGNWIGEALSLFGTNGTAPLGSVVSNLENSITVTVSGGNVNSSNRRYYFSHKTITGDFIFTARLASVTATGGSFTTTANNAYRFGLLITENINIADSYVNSARFAEAGFYTTAATPVFRGSRGYKLDTGAGSSFTRNDIGAAGALGVGSYMRISRAGTNVSIYSSTDGVNFTLANTSSFAQTNTSIPDTWYVGFFAAPQQELTLVFDNISIIQNQ